MFVKNIPSTRRPRHVFAQVLVGAVMVLSLLALGLSLAPGRLTALMSADNLSSTLHLSTASHAAHGSQVSVTDRAGNTARTWLYLCGGDLCRSWTYDGWRWTHATPRHSGMTSYDTGWVPNAPIAVRSPFVPAWVWEGAQQALASHPSGTSSGSPHTSPAPSPWISPTPRGVSQWAFTGHSAYREWDIAAWNGNKSALSYPFGQCTWGAAYFAHDNVAWLGNAKDWLWNAQRRGMPTGYAPSAGATVVFQPYVQGASGLGHVAHVVAVYSNGWFLIEEMNFYWNGGGWGTVSYRYAHTGSGVSFIY